MSKYSMYLPDGCRGCRYIVSDKDLVEILQGTSEVCSKCRDVSKKEIVQGIVKDIYLLKRQGVVDVNMARVEEKQKRVIEEIENRYKQELEGKMKALKNIEESVDSRGKNLEALKREYEGIEKELEKGIREAREKAAERMKEEQEREELEISEELGKMYEEMLDKQRELRDKESNLKIKEEILESREYKIKVKEEELKNKSIEVIEQEIRVKEKELLGGSGESEVLKKGSSSSRGIGMTYTEVKLIVKGIKEGKTYKEMIDEYGVNYYKINRVIKNDYKNPIPRAQMARMKEKAELDYWKNKK